MAKFTVKAPDGRTFDVNAPAGATQADAIAYVKRTQYAPEVEQEPEQPKRSLIDTVKDWLDRETTPESLKRAAGLTGRTIIEGATDLPVAAGDAVVGGVNKLLPDSAQLPSISASRDYTLRGLPQAQGGIEETTAAIGRGVTGAATGTGIASLIAKVAPALSTTQKVSQVVADAPGLAAVSGGTSAASSDVARQMGASPGVQLAAGLAGGVAPSLRQLRAAAVRASPASTTRAAETATRDSAVRTLLENDIPLSAEQRGANVIGSLSRGADAVVGKSSLPAKQQRAFTRAALKHVGVDAEAATPEVMRDLQLRLGFEFDDLANTVPTKVDKKLVESIEALGNEARSELDESSLGPILRQIENIKGKVQAGQPAPTIDGRAAQNARTSLGRLSASQNSSVKYFAGRIREELDEALERSASPKDAARVKKVRDQYKAMKQIEDAVAGNPEGQVSAAKLYNVMSQKRNRGQTIYGKGEQGLVELARAGKQVLKDPVGDSGTASRLGPLGMVLGTIAAPAIGAKVIATTLASRAANEFQPVAKLIGGTGVRKPVNTAPAQGGFASAGLSTVAEAEHRKRKRLADALRAPTPFR